MLPDQEIESDIKLLEEGFHKLMNKIKHFNILSKELVPEGLKPHTRSISWLAEQVFKQQARKNLSEIGFESLIDADSDIESFDCKVNINGRDVLVNLKVSAAKSKNGSRNDINKAYKLLKMFEYDEDTLLYYVIIKITFENTDVILVDGTPTVFYVPWIHEVYVNPSNHHLQANYELPMKKRTVAEFIRLIDEEIETKKVPRK